MIKLAIIENVGEKAGFKIVLFRKPGENNLEQIIVTCSHG